jgi:hypothetical protein
MWTLRVKHFREVLMKVKKSLIAVLSLILLGSSIAVGKDKKGQRGMLESMQSVPCGAKERGLTGLGSMVAAVGVEHVNSHEQLCPQYLLRTDEMDYHIRPVDTKHAVVLPIGHEAEFKIKKDRMFLRVADGGKKELPYQVVSMQPADSEGKPESSAYHPVEKPTAPRPADPGVGTPNPGVDSRANNQTPDRTPQQ